MMQFKNLSVARKITTLLLLMVSASLLGVGIYTYLSIYGTVERLLGQKLDHIARTSSLIISASDHKKIEQAFVDGVEDIADHDYFKNVQKELQEIKAVNNLHEHIYTVIAPEWGEGNMIFMSMSNEKPYVGNAIPVHPLVKKVSSPLQGFIQQPSAITPRDFIQEPLVLLFLRLPLRKKGLLLIRS